MTGVKHPSPYDRFATSELALRDVLAVDRTVAANERTFLGYVRTTLALLAAGGSLLHFVSATWATLVGLLFVAAAVPVFAFGLERYLYRRRTLGPLMSKRAADDRATTPETTSDPVGGRGLEPPNADRSQAPTNERRERISQLPNAL